MKVNKNYRNIKIYICKTFRHIYILKRGLVFSADRLISVPGPSLIFNPACERANREVNTLRRQER